MRYQFLIFILFIALGSCAILRPQNKSEYCKERISFVRNNIYLSDTTHMIYKFRSDTGAIPLIYEGNYFGTNCLINWRKKEIRKVLGNPSINYNKNGNKNVWRYYLLFDDCGEPDGECPYWDIKFDKLNLVQSLKEEVRNKKPPAGRP